MTADSRDVTRHETVTGVVPTATPFSIRYQSLFMALQSWYSDNFGTMLMGTCNLLAV